MICEQYTKLFKIELTSCLKQGMSKNKPNAQKMYNRKDNENYYRRKKKKRQVIEWFQKCCNIGLETRFLFYGCK